MSAHDQLAQSPIIDNLRCHEPPENCRD